MRILGVSSYALLGLLLGGAKHGYELHQAYNDPVGLGQVWRLGLSRLYAELKQLEMDGLVESTRHAQELRPAKKTFKLTPAGRLAFKQWIETPARGVRELRVEFMVRYYFAERTSKKAVGILMERQCESLKKELTTLTALPTISESHNFERLVRTFRISQLRAALDWLEGGQKLFTPR